jgi:hypothetical protein
MSNYYRQRRQDEEGICTVTALQWVKTCLERRRGIGNYNELGLTDFQLDALMAVWRRFDHDPIQQSHAFGLRVIGGADRAINSLRALQQEVANTAPYTAIFWNSYHTMGYRVGTGRVREYEWFDKNHGYYVDTDEDELLKFMRTKWNEMYFGAEGRIIGVRILDL